MLVVLVVGYFPVAATLALAIPGSYAVSRRCFPGRSRIGLRASLAALVVVYVSQTVAVSISMLRNYFETVPVSLGEAAAWTT